MTRDYRRFRDIHAGQIIEVRDEDNLISWACSRIPAGRWCVHDIKIDNQNVLVELKRYVWNEERDTHECIGSLWLHPRHLDLR